jgi:hypothetical protein
MHKVSKAEEYFVFLISRTEITYIVFCDAMRRDQGRLDSKNPLLFHKEKGEGE